VPKYKEEVERLRNGEVLDDASDEEVQVRNDSSDKEESSSEEEEKEAPPAQENGVEDGDNKDDEESDDSSKEEEDDEEAERNTLQKKQTEVSNLRATIYTLIFLAPNSPSTSNTSIHKRTRKQLVSPKPLCPRKLPASTGVCNMASPRSKPKLTISTRSVVRLRARERERVGRPITS